MRFVKMHGAENDYVFLDGFRAPAPKSLSQLAIAVSDRHTGVGADGLVLMQPSERADARMRIWNADGSEAEMCGNGLRCVAKYLFDRKLAPDSRMRIETGGGVLSVSVEESDGRSGRVRIDMGRPVLSADAIPTHLPGDPPVDVALPEPAGAFRATAVSMGNPHCVIFTESLSEELVQRWGPVIERLPVFPRRTNVEFVRCGEPDSLEIRVWERGSGETRACGTGACAAVVAAALTGRTGRRLRCRLPGGVLEVDWVESGSVFLTGPAVEVFAGEWPDECLDG